MFGKSLKNLNTKLFVKRQKYNFYNLENICTQNEFSYKKIEITKSQNINILDKDFYIYVNSGVLFINKKKINTESLFYSKKTLSFVANKNTTFYIFFFKKVYKPKLVKSKIQLKSNIFLKSYKKKKKYWGLIIDLVNNENGAIKIIHMNKSTQSSMEFHINKKENYFLEYGNLDLGIRYARAINALIKLSKNCSFLMNPGTMHMRMTNTDCKIVEISTKDFDNDSIIVHDGKKYKFKVGKC